MNVRDLLDPEIEPFLAGFPFDHVDDEVLAKVRTPAPPVPLSDDVARTDHVVPGAPHVSVRLLRAKDTDGLLPCVYSVHGGGFVMGTCGMYDLAFDRWCPNLQV